MRNRKSISKINRYFCLLPTQGSCLAEQLTDCYQQLFSLLASAKIDQQKIVKQTFFIKSIGNDDYLNCKQLIMQEISVLLEFIPPTSIVAQAPVDNWLVALEVHCIENDGTDTEIHHKTVENCNYVVLQNTNNKQIIAAGLTTESYQNDMVKQCQLTFDLLETILQAEGMTCADIVRQWNYIENITQNSREIGRESQHYQVFNDVRSGYYAKHPMLHGYPAATGIGTTSGGIIIDFIAIKGDEQLKVVPIKNPLQIDAYHYPETILGENKSMKLASKTSPKFERAKAVCINGITLIYVSGTAAIRGQTSIEEQNIAVHTAIALENIVQLVSPENLKNHGIAVDPELELYSTIRVYVKNKNDIPEAQKICAKSFPSIPVHYVESAICRDDLLVEIEAFIEY